MKRTKRTLTLLLAMVIAMTAMFTGCTNKETSTGDGERMTITIGYPSADETWTNDEYYRYIADKFNIDIEFQTLSAETAAEKARIWISSGSMPDIVMTTAFSMDEYSKYAEQGMVRALPEGWQEKYPNVGFGMEMTGLMSELEAMNDGEIFAIFRPQDAYADYIGEFREAYKNGEDLEAMMKQAEYMGIDNYGFAYRKDWAEKLGIKTDYIMTYDDFMEMARKFKEADLGGVGATNAIGIAADYTEAPNFFVTAYNSRYKYFHKETTGEYICGYLEDSTAEGVKAYAEAYRSGILAPDFYTQKPQDLNSLFCSQRAGIIFPRASLHNLRSLDSEFEKANPGLKAKDCIDVCWVVTEDGKMHGRERTNYYGLYYFNPEMSDEKMDRILQLANYCSSVEGGPQVRLGVPEVDYTVKENGEIEILREANADGVLETLDKKYPSYEFFRYFLNPFFDYSVDSDPYAKEIAAKLIAAKRQYEPAVLAADVKRDFYTADDYVKFNAANDANGMLAEIVVAEGDIEKNWKKKCDEIRKEAESVAKNMNKALLK